MNDFLNISILLGTVQGIITSVLLFRLKTHKQANKLLAWIILLISLACLNIYLLETLENNNSVVWNFMEAIVPLVVIMPIGPLMYLYVKSILNPSFKLDKTSRFHFYSIILDFVPSFLILLYILGGFLGLIRAENNFSLGNFIETYNLYVDIPRWLSLVLYLWLAFKVISTHKNDPKNEVFIKWTKRFVLGFTIFAAIWFFHLVLYIIPASSNMLLGIVGWYPVYIPLIILVYWLGINGYIISFKTFKTASKAQEITQETIQNTIASLEYVMKEEKLYLNPSLKLSDVIKQTNIPQKIISTVLNQHLHKSFNEYVNTYRIEELKSRLLAANAENFTITGIAFECGFNSQATFQRVFKAITNQSPSEFRKAHKKIK